MAAPRRRCQVPEPGRPPRAQGHPAWASPGSVPAGPGAGPRRRAQPDARPGPGTTSGRSVAWSGPRPGTQRGKPSSGFPEEAGVGGRSWRERGPGKASSGGCCHGNGENKKLISTGLGTHVVDM